MKTLSKTIEFPINSKQSINVSITKKRMKNIRLVISKNGTVKVSMPYSTSYSYCYQFLVRKRDWINSQINKINTNLQQTSCNFVNNGNIFLLGHNYPLTVELGNKNIVVFNNLSLEQNSQVFKIYTKNFNHEYVQLIFTKWCKKYFLDYFINRLKYLYEQIFTDKNYPLVKIKTMKSMWGNCNFVKRIVSLNIYLAKTPIECIDYVLVHELAHLIHHNHSKDFHALMTKLMPDWKIRKKMLNNYSLRF